MRAREAASEELKEVVERLYGCQATYKEAVRVREEFQVEVVWEGIVSQFDLAGHPEATTCYAWSSPIEG